MSKVIAQLILADLTARRSRPVENDISTQWAFSELRQTSFSKRS